MDVLFDANKATYARNFLFRQQRLVILFIGHHNTSADSDMHPQRPLRYTAS